MYTLKRVTHLALSGWHSEGVQKLIEEQEAIAFCTKKGISSKVFSGRHSRNF
jgi:hypothetical protein